MLRPSASLLLALGGAKRPSSQPVQARTGPRCTRAERLPLPALIRYLRETTRPEDPSPLINPDHLRFGDDVGACRPPDVFDCGESWEVKPGNIQGREPEVIIMRAVALGRLGLIIMPVAKVVHTLGHSAGLSFGGSLPQSCFAGADVGDGPVPERPGRSIRILNHHREAARLLGSATPLQGRRD